MDPYYKPNTDPFFSDCHSGFGFSGQYGTRLICDNYINAIRDVFSFWKTKVETDKIDFILWTGDNARLEDYLLFYNIFTN